MDGLAQRVILSLLASRKDFGARRDYLGVTHALGVDLLTATATKAETLEQRFDRLMREHGPALARLAGAYERDVHDREDLIQEIAFAIWLALPTYRGECSERTFLFRIGHNRAITHCARRRTRHDRIEHDVDLSAVPDSRPDPAANVLIAEGRADLMTAVRRLRPTLLQVVVLTLEGLTHSEIADVLGVSDNAVAVRLTRARAELASLLVTGDGP